MKKMPRIDDALQLLNSLIFSTIDGMVKVSNETLFNIQTFLQNAQENIEFLQLETKLQQEELQQKRHPSKLVQNNSLFDFETGSYQQPASHQVSNVEFDPHQLLISRAVSHKYAEV